MPHVPPVLPIPGAAPLTPPDALAPPVAPPAAVEPPPLPADWPQWKERISAARRVAKDLVAKGRQRVKNYRQKPLDGDLGRDVVRVPAEFYFVEQKRPQMFYRLPDVMLTGKTPQAEVAAPLMQAVINCYLGPDKTNAATPIDEVLFDILCPMGYGAVKIGYRSVTKDVTDPLTGQIAKTPIYEAYEIDRIPPGRLLIPTDFHGSDFDKAPWLGFEVYTPVEKGAKGAKKGSGKDGEESLLSPALDQQGQLYYRRDVEVWYRASILDPSVEDPDHLRMFVWRDGDSEPHRHEDNPNAIQTPDGSTLRMEGFPISVATIRYVSDTWKPPSDCEIIENTVQELSRGRTQLLVGRDRNMPQVGYNESAVSTDTLGKIQRGESFGFIGMKSGGQNDIWPIQKGQVSAENYAFNTVGMKDIERAMAMGSAQQGVESDERTTATENQIVQQNSDTRLDYERNKFVNWYLQKVVKKLARLIQMFADRDDYVRAIGPEGEAVLTQWNRMNVQGDFYFDVKVNSQLRPDSQSELRNTTAWINYSAQSPYVDQLQNWKDGAKVFGKDPNRIVRQPPPPPAPTPEPPKLSFNIKGEDLNPMMPQYPNILALMKSYSIDGLAPAASQAPENQPTTETAPQAPVLDKHRAGMTGQLPGQGAVVAEQTGSTPRSQVN